MQRRVNTQPRFWAFVIAVMLVCFMMSGVVSQLHYSRVSGRVYDLSSEKLMLTSRIADLKNQLKYVQTDDYIQRVARDELNMIMPGEIRYVSNGF